MKLSRSTACLLLSAAIYFLSACNPTKKLSEGEYLLDKNIVVDKYAKVDKGEMEAYIKQKPNRKLLFWRMYLHIYNGIDQEKLEKIKMKRKAKQESYNAKKIEKYNRINAKREAKGKKKKEYSISKEPPFILREWWLSVGEPPVIYDSLLAKKSEKQIKLFLNNKGYFKSTVKDSVSLPHHKKVKSFYIVHEGIPYTIRNLSYEIKDAQLEYYALSEASASLIQRGVNYDVDVLQRERDRLTQLLHNAGYYQFAKEYIYFEVDSSLGLHQVDLTLGIKNPLVKTGEKNISGGDSIREVSHQRFYVKNIYMHTDYDPRLKDVRKDTLPVNDSTLYLLYTGRLRYKPSLLSGGVFISKGELFQQKHADQTYRRLSELKLFRTVQIAFIPAGGDKLDCNIYLSNIPKQSFSAETEGINTSGTLGIAGSLVYQNKNTFKGGEIFEVKLKGALEVQKTKTKEENQILTGIESPIPFNTLELGGEAGMRVPRFLIPFWKVGQKSNNAKTNFTGTYNFQKRPDFGRSIANLSYGYSWNETAAKQHLINPIEYNLVNIGITSEELQNTIDNSTDLFLRNSYSKHFTLDSRYAFVYNNQDINKVKSYSYFRFGFEGAGNVMRQAFKYIDKNIKELDKGYDTVFSTKGYSIEKYYTIENIRFSQYLRTDFDYRHYKTINDKDRLVYRFALGVGKPFANLRVLPLEKSFFAGGPNSVRAWQARTLGPGSYSDPAGNNFSDKIGDNKIEANIEYRFNVIKILNAALFADAGNIWLRKPYATYPGGDFRFKRTDTTTSFAEEIAIGAGMGFRLDFNFFIIRLDAAFKVRDPARKPDDRWMFGHQPLNDMVFNFGIGYPF